MNEIITTKEQILTSIRNALISKRENPFDRINFNDPVYYDLEDEKEVVFASKLLDNNGKFVYCENEQQAISILQTLMNEKGWESVFAPDEKLVEMLQAGNINVDFDEEQFSTIKGGITRCDFLIARFGSVMVSSALGSGRRMFVFPESHIVFAYASQVVVELKEALVGMKEKYARDFPSQVTVITGPSRTADIEKTLVMGAHGPKELYVFMIDDLQLTTD
jgi:L-lactate dehydrogenase complex protein LldG